MRIILLIVGIWGNLLLYAQERNQMPIEKLLVKNRYYDVLKCTDSLFKAGEVIPDLFFYAGKASEGVMRYKNALMYYKKWQESDTTNRDARIAVARVALLAGHTEEALQYYQELAAEDTLDFTVNYQLARIHQQKGRPMEAAVIYDRLLTADSVNAFLAGKLGDCYADAGLPIGAVRNYDTAFRLDPENGGMALKAVNTLLANQDRFMDFVDYAIEIIDTAMIYSPQMKVLRQSRGVLEYLANRSAKCENTFAGLIQEGDSARLNFKYLGLARFQQENYAGAIKALAIADSLFRDKEGKRTDLEVAMKYGEALARGNFALQALGVFNEIGEQMQPDKRFLSQLAVMCGMASEYSRQKAEAIKYFWKAYKLNPKNILAISNFVSYKNSLLLDEENRAKASSAEIGNALFAHILFLQNVKDHAPTKKNTQHAVSRELLQKELDELFFRGEKQLVVMDPDGKNYTYPIDEIRKLIE